MSASDEIIGAGEGPRQPYESPDKYLKLASGMDALEAARAKRAYLKDAWDLIAYALYVAAEVGPLPERPNGWLNEAEKDTWKLWRDRARELGRFI